MDTIPFGESIEEIIAMLVDSPEQIVGDPSIQGPLRFAGHDVNVVLMHGMWIPAFAGMRRRLPPAEAVFDIV